MIKAIPGGPALPVTQDADSVAFLLRCNNGAAATHFDKWVSRNAFPYRSGKRRRINRDFRVETAASAIAGSNSASFSAADQGRSAAGKSFPK
jgi:hypothetical protein